MKTTMEMIREYEQEQAESIAVFYLDEDQRVLQCTSACHKSSLRSLMIWISGWGMRDSGRAFVGNVPRRSDRKNSAGKIRQ